MNVSCLKQLEEDREWLVREINHRVKNNLQIVISLLNTQCSYLTNQDALEAIKNSQHRMYALSLIHQKLYQPQNLSTINMVEYVHELADYLKDAYAPAGRITFRMAIAPLQLDVNLAVPLGLIINEAVSNSLKYAFDGQAAGEVSISGKKEGGNFVFRVADNGIGLPENFDVNSRNSLGISLMAGLSGQLGGTYDMTAGKGVQVTVQFKNPAPLSLIHFKTAC